jgi:hypothetical protein
MDLYPWVVFTHAASVLLFFILHGVSMGVAFQVRSERNPERLRALLDLSRASLGAPAIVLSIVGLLSGVAAGFMGEWWGQLWIWISLGLFVAVGIAMTPLVGAPLNAIRAAAGQPNPRRPDQPAAENIAELERLQAAWQPVPIAIAGIGAFLVILYLMLVKPF